MRPVWAGPEPGWGPATTGSSKPSLSPLQMVVKAGPGFALNATYDVVHPSEAGFDVPWLPLDAYEGRSCKLQVGIWRLGLHVWWHLWQLNACPTSCSALPMVPAHCCSCGHCADQGVSPGFQVWFVYDAARFGSKHAGWHGGTVRPRQTGTHRQVDQARCDSNGSELAGCGVLGGAPGHAVGSHSPLNSLLHALCLCPCLSPASTADTWKLDSGKFRALTPEEAGAAFCQEQQRAQLQVVHPSKGDITAKGVGGLVGRALNIAQVSRACCCWWGHTQPVTCGTLPSDQLHASLHACLP